MENEFFAPEIRDLDDALAAIDSEARALVAGLSESNGAWRATPSSWSIAECLDHLAHANRVYSPPWSQQPAAPRRRDRAGVDRLSPGCLAACSYAR